ncbi:putative reverse transcriptase, RNA-dependent DNA polymerase [Tanacetum coccineum]
MDANVNNTNNVNTVSSTDNAAGIQANVVNENIVYGCAGDPNMPELEDIVYSNNDEDVRAEADMNNLDTYFQVSHVPTTRIHKDHPLNQVIGDLQSAPQTRRMTKNLEAHELPNEKRAIGTKWVFRNKKDKRGIMIKNKARLVAQGYTQEERIDYDDVFALVFRIESIRLFLAYALFKDFVVYQMDVKSAFLYDKIEEEVYIFQPPGFEDPDFPDKVYKEMCTEFEKMMHKKFQMSSMGELTFFLASTPMKTHKTLLKDDKGEDVDDHLYRSMIRSLMYLTSSRPDIMFALGLWYPKDSPFDLVAYNDSDYAGESLDRKSTTRAEYIAASNCCGQLIWIQNQLLDYGYKFMQTKIHIDNKSTICIVKNLIFHSKTKHIKIRHHFIRDSNEKKLIQMIKIHTDQNVADLLTKAFEQKARILELKRRYFEEYCSEDQYVVSIKKIRRDLDNSTSNVLIPLDSWISGLLVYKLPLSGKKYLSELVDGRRIPQEVMTEPILRDDIGKAPIKSKHFITSNNINGEGEITIWEELVEKFFCKFYPKSYDGEEEMLDGGNNWGIDQLEFISRVNSSFDKHTKVDGRTKKVLFHAWINGDWNKRRINESTLLSKNTTTDSFFKPYLIKHRDSDTKKNDEQGQAKRKHSNTCKCIDKQPNKRRCKSEKFKAIQYSLGPNEEYIAIRSYEYDI